MSVPAQALFQQQWPIYRTLVDENYLFHQEAYKCLHQILVEDAVQPFRFLDIACGDATASVAALTGTRIAHYHGIDRSRRTSSGSACHCTISARRRNSRSCALFEISSVRAVSC